MSSPDSKPPSLIPPAVTAARSPDTFRAKSIATRLTEAEFAEVEEAAARDGKTLATFRGTAEGIILDSPRGTNGFGYDPLFYFPQIKKTFAELTAEEKSNYSHRGAAFQQFLNWCKDFTGN